MRSRWTTRRQGEVLGYLVRHPDSTVEDIAEHYTRHPDQIRDTLNQLEADGEVVARFNNRHGLLGATFIALEWILTNRSADR